MMNLANVLGLALSMFTYKVHVRQSRQRGQNENIVTLVDPLKTVCKTSRFEGKILRHICIMVTSQKAGRTTTFVERPAQP